MPSALALRMSVPGPDAVPLWARASGASARRARRSQDREGTRIQGSYHLLTQFIPAIVRPAPAMTSFVRQIIGFSGPVGAEDLRRRSTVGAQITMLSEIGRAMSSSMVSLEKTLELITE